MADEQKLSEIKRALLEKRLAGKGRSKDSIPRRPVSLESVRLTFSQQRLWFLDMFESGSASFNIPAAVKLDGKLDVEVLHRAFNEIVQRHESLRTRIGMRDGAPEQLITPSLELTMPLTDLSELPQGEREARAQWHAQDEAQTPFNLETGPLIRAGLIRLSPESHVVLITVHHIVADGWSMGIMVKEVAALYAAFSQGQASPLPELAIQYADFAHWQQQQLSGESLERQLNYWVKQLGGAPTLLSLPTDRPRPHAPSDRGGEFTITIDTATTQSLNQLCQARQSTLFMALNAAFAILLSRYAGQYDICIGTPIANRSRTETEALIGFFASTLVLRTQIDTETGFDALLAQVRQTVLGAYAHQDLPFEQLLEVLKPERSAGHSPLFQVMLILQNTPTGHIALPGLTLETVDASSDTAKFDLTLNAAEIEGRLNVVFEYSTDLFDRSTIERMAGHFSRLVQSIIADPAKRIADLDMMTRAERDQLTLGWNNTAAPYPAHQTIHQLFEEQVSRTPDAVAVVYAGQSLRYGELNDRANRLAHYLRSQGVVPDTLVGICVERSLDMIVGLIGILKAGAGYLPLDPKYPQERLAYMVSDAQPRLIVTQQQFVETLPGSIPRFCIDTQSELLGKQPTTNPQNRTAPGNLAYVIYTSGSTGTPKGVMNLQGNVVHHIFAHSALCQFSANDKVLQFASINFDASVEEIFPPLMVGAQLIIRPAEFLGVGEALHGLIGQHGISVLDLPTAFWHEWTHHLHGAENRIPDSVRLVIVGGEKVDAERFAAWKRSIQGHSLRWLNTYGPTETTVTATCFEQTEHDTASIDVPIGSPIGNCQVYLLDSNLEPVAIGVTGELYIAGDGVARGYLNRAELTAERFIPNPFGSNPGSRMYKSGDLGRYLANGLIVYVGRTDDQVKIRGFRIELGEIEAALHAIAGIQQAVVTVYENADTGKRLVAYLVAPELAELDTHYLRTNLLRLLPEYMIPAQFVQLDALPISVNGKIDRQKLPAPEALAGSVHYVPPRNHVEEAIASVWAEVLKLEQVGIYDNFFSLGGHSLLAVSIVERLRNMGLRIEIRDLFAMPVIAELAQTVDKGRSRIAVPPNGIPSPCDAINPEMLPLIALKSDEIAVVESRISGGAANIQDIYPLAPLQEGILFHHRLREHGDTYLVPLSIALKDRETLDRFIQALQVVIDRHDILRTAFLWDSLPEPVQVVQRKATINLQEVVIDADAGDVAEQLSAQFDPNQIRIELDQAPLIRAVASADTKNDRWVLLLLTHHLVTDHTTLEILVSEILAIMSGEQARLSPPVPYRGYVAEARLGVSPEEHRAFFSKMLADVTEPTLPFGLTDIHGAGAGIDLFKQNIDAELSVRIRRQARRMGVSVASLMHLAWARVLSAVTGQPDVVFGTILIGRMQSGAAAEQVAGLFINTLPIRIRLDRRSVSDAALHAHSALIQLLDHEHASLAMVQRLSGVSGSTPLFSALLNYRHTHSTEVGEQNNDDPGELGIDVLSGTEYTNYPLTLSVDDFGVGFALEAMVSSKVTAKSVCDYMGTALMSLVAALESAPETMIAGVDVVPESERRTILLDWNNTDRNFPEHMVLQQHVESQAAQNPDRIALVCEGTALSYGELNTSANRLAHYLREIGVKPESLVGLYASRSNEMMIGLVGILKAGGAYLPLDPEYPLSRLEFMVKDAGAAVILAEASGLDLFNQPNIRTVCLDSKQEWLQQYPDHNPVILNVSDNIAYVNYTSGSTGQPKGVITSHRAVNRLIFDTDYVDLQPTDVMAQIANSAFDALTFEVWSAFAYGCRLCILSKDTVVSPTALAAAIDGQSIDIMFMTSALFNQMAGFVPGSMGRLRYLMVGGDIVDSHSVQTVMRAGPPKNFLNVYGPTESTTYATWHRISQEDVDHRHIPIGRPIANTRIYILDEQLNVAPIGATGELYIAGAGLARGYLGQATLTADKFVPDPYAKEAGTRMYRTGDLARYSQDGEVEYLGRIDQQVKIRGFRIELGEIESTIKGYEGVRDALVLAHTDHKGDKRLVAYLVWKNEAIDSDYLRASLGQSLPEYMVPSQFINLDALPLTANGKIDRKALPLPDMLRANVERVAPRTETEQVLARIWSEVLKLELASVHENFFELGGHSLIATQIIAKVRNAFQIDLPLKVLFESPTVELLAQRIEEQKITQEAVSAAIQPLDQQEDYALSAAQRRLWILHRLDPRNTAYHVPALIELPDWITPNLLENALSQLVERHEVLRTVFRVGDDALPRQKIEAAQAVHLQEHSIEQEDDLRDYVTALNAQAFDLERGPLFRAEILRTTRSDGHPVNLLAWCMHEIIADGSSTLVLQRDVLALIDASVKAQTAELPAMSIQYKDYAAWQNHMLRAGENGSRDYWHRQLSGEITRLVLPFDHAVTAASHQRGASCQLILKGPIYEQIKSLCRERQMTLFMLLQASYAAWLHRMTGQQDIAVATPVAGRGRAELEPLIGFFLNTLLLRTRVHGEDSFDALLTRSKDDALQMLEHQHYPFEQLIEELDLPRPLNQFPVTPILFNVLNFLEQGPLELREGIESGRAHRDEERDMKVELELTIREHLDGLAIICEYRSALFKSSTIDYLLLQWKQLLEQAVMHPAKRIIELAVFDDAIAYGIPSPYLQFAGAAASVQGPASVLERLQSVVRTSPDAIALTCGEHNWSYAELARRSNRVARQLQQLGCQTGEVVALLLEDPMEHIAVVLGTMQVGAVFATLDAGDPPVRLKQLIERIEPRWWIAEADTASVLSSLGESSKLQLEGIWSGNVSETAMTGLPGMQAQSELIEQDSDLHTIVVDGDAPCYLFFTSGSSGVPKPILGRSRSLAQFIDWEIDTFKLDANCRVSQLTAPTFDAFLRDMFVPLCAGGRLCLPPARKLGPDQMLEWMEEQGINLVHCVPSVLRALLAYCRLEPEHSSHITLSRLERVCLSGEVLLSATVKEWRSRFGTHTELVNFYGASETTMIRCYHQIGEADLIRSTIPVGRPIRGTQVVILNDQHQVCGIDQPGEIYFRSHYFSLGYYRLPEQSAEVFVENPLRLGQGELVYRSGDMGQWQADGTLQYLGRRDGQVKVNGVRIEVGEIENVLLAHAAVEDAAVIAQRTEDGATSLHAFVVADPSVQDELRAYLAERLPAAIQPQRLVVQESLPMTASGKIDRKALGMQAADERPAATAYVAPGNAFEKQLVQLFEEVLGREQVGIHDDFFALGGHSLRALMVLARIRKTFQVDLPLKALFEAPTVEQLAKEVETIQTLLNTSINTGNMDDLEEIEY